MADRAFPRFDFDEIRADDAREIGFGAFQCSVSVDAFKAPGLFDTVRIREEQLDALRRFDVAMARRAGEIDVAVKELAAAASGGDPEAAIAALGAKVAELSRLYDRRHEAVVAPDLLLDSGYAPAEETTG